MEEVARKLKRHCRRPELVEAFQDIKTSSMYMNAHMFAGYLHDVDPDAHKVAVACCKLLDWQFTDLLSSLKRGELPEFITGRRVAMENAIDAATSNTLPAELRNLIIDYV